MAKQERAQGRAADNVTGHSEPAQILLLTRDARLRDRIVHLLYRRNAPLGRLTFVESIKQTREPFAVEADVALVDCGESFDNVPRMLEEHPDIPIVALVRGWTETAYRDAIEAGAIACLEMAELSGPLVRHAIQGALRQFAVDRARQEREAQLHAQFWAIPVPTYAWEYKDGVFRLVGYNAAADAITHGGIGAWLGKTNEDIHADKPEIGVSLQRCLEYRTAFSQEMDYPMRSTGRLHRFRVTYVYVPPNRVLAYTDDISERRAAEAALRESETKYRLLAENLADVIWTLDLNLRFTYISPSVERVLGYTVEEALTMMPRTIVTPEDERRVVAVLSQNYELLRHEGPDRRRNELLELDHVRKDGSIVPCELRASFVLDSTGRPTGIVGVTRDISERKQALEALRQSEERYRRISDAITDYIYTVRVENGHVADTVHGPTSVAVTGYASEEFHEDPDLWIRMVYPDDRERVAAHAEGILVRGDVTPIEHRIVRKDGEIRWVRNTPVPHYDMRGVLLSYDGLLSDITEQKEIEGALRESEEKYRNLVENAYDGICVIQDGRLAYANPQLAAMLRLPSRALNDAPIARFLVSGIENSFFDAYEDALRPRAAAKTFEAVLLSQHGERIEVEIKASPMTFAGRPAGIAFVRDITERNRAERLIAEQKLAMATASKMSALGIMASGMAHEINNPLAVISGGAEQLRDMLAEGTFDARLAGPLAERIARHTARIAAIVKALRLFSRDGTHDPFEPIAVRRIVEESIEISKTRFDAHGIALEVGSIPPDLDLECQPGQIAQVLLNLLNNAFDAVESLDERWVRLDVEATKDTVAIAVTDSGRGISDEVLDRMFQPFFTTKGVGKGVGLGLSIAAGIAKNHNGALFFDGNSPNTRAVLRLPRRQQTEPVRKRSARGDSGNGK